MDVLRDPAHIGMFEPQDLEVLKGVFTRLKATGTSWPRFASAENAIGIKETP